MNVCKEHLIFSSALQKQNSSFECTKCLKKFNLNEIKDFKENLHMKMQLENNFHLDQNEKEIKQSLEGILIGMEKTLNEFQLKIDEFALRQSDHFDNIRNRIDIQRETLLQNFHNDPFKNPNGLHELSQKIIKRIDETEANFRTHFNTRIKPFLVNINLLEEKANLNEFLRDPLKFTQDLKNKFELKLNSLENKIFNFTYYEWDLLNRFRLIENYEKFLLGQLDLCLSENFLNLEDQQLLQNVFTYYSQKEIHVLNLNTNRVIYSFDGHVQGIECLAQCGNTVVSACRDMTVKIWNFSSGKCEKTYVSHQNSPLGSRLVYVKFIYTFFKYKDYWPPIAISSAAKH